jgi:HlyD family secretion protein
MVIKTANGPAARGRLVAASVLIILALIFVSGWIMRRGPVAVRTEKVVSEDIASVISTNGKIEPVANFEAHAPASTTVKRVLVQEGDHVRAGQLLLQLDAADARAQAAKAQAELSAAEASLHAVQTGGTQEEILTTRSELTRAVTDRDEAQRNLQALKHLQQNGAASPAEVQDAQNKLTRAEAQVQLLQARQTDRFSTPEIEKVKATAGQARADYAAAQDLLNNASVRAPFSGTVYQLPVKAGSYVQSGALLVQMADLSRLQVRAFVDEPEIGRVAKGQQVNISWDAMPGRVWNGQLTRIPTVVTTLGTRSVGEVTCEISDPEHKLLPSVNVNAGIVTARHPHVLTVSREAMHEVDGKRYVYEVSENKIHAREVSTGISSLTRVEVSGIAAGAEIVRGAMSAQPLQNGMEVKVVQH